MRIFKIILILVFGFLVAPNIFGGVRAAILKFNQNSVSANANEVFTVDVVVDAGSDQILATDAYVVYDSALLEAQKVDNGSFYNTVFNNISSGKVYVAGVVEDAASYKTGSGTIATITFKALKDGSGTLSYYCDTSKSDTSKIIKNDVNATNIIECSSNGQINVVVGSGGGGDSNPPSGDTSGGTTTNPTNNNQNVGGGNASTLPKSGVVDNILKYGIPGSILFLLGVGVKFII